MRFKTYGLTGFKALGEDEAPGQFEAIVAVFNNVDRGGDTILPGAFKDTLAVWNESGDPIPVIFAHEWDNLDAHIGQVLEAKEVDEGLYVKAQLDMDEPFASRVWKKMRGRTLKQFSFAYDVVKSSILDNGEEASPRYVNQLEQLDLLEVGPCLVGMNPETELIAVKNRLAALKGDPSTKDAAMLQEIHDLSTALGAKCADAADDSDGKDDGDGGDEAPGGKSDGVSPSVLAAHISTQMLEL